MRIMQILRLPTAAFAAVFALALSWTATDTVVAWTTTTTKSQMMKTPAAAAAPVSRQGFLQTTAAALLTVPFVAPSLANAAETLPNGVSYTVVKQGNGPKPEVGELIAIRFSAYYGDVKIDDIFDTPEPYYMRVGSASLIKGVEQTIPLMNLGDRWKLTIPVRIQHRQTRHLFLRRNN